MEGSIISLLPPVITITLIILTRRILWSLGIGVIFGALLANQWNVSASVVKIVEIMVQIISEGSILLFVIIVGVMTSLIYVSGGITAFSEWAIKKVKTRFQAQLVTLVLGFFSFFDDAFSCLFRGSVMRPLTDKHRISHSKLSYLIHSTSAPVIIVTPISGWAAFIAAFMGTILVQNGITEYQAFEAFLLTIPTNYYAISTLLLVFAAAYFGLDIGQMRRDEKLATEQAILFDNSKGTVTGQSESGLPTRKDGTVVDLFLPVFTLIIVAIVIAIWIGISNTEGAITAVEILKNTEVITALVYGGLLACAVSIIRLWLKKTPVHYYTSGIIAGIQSVLPSVMILFLALMIAQIISLLGVGQYLAALIDGNIAIFWLPVIFFIISAFMSFSMGSTFGTFGMMLPIGAEIVTAIEIAYLIPVFGAVLAGSIFGEHSSPLSDTTILASIGSGVHPIDHIMTQLPYALICSVVSVIGYITLGLTKSLLVGLLVTLGSLVLIIFILRNQSSRKSLP